MIKWIPFNSDSPPPNDKVVIVCGCCEMVAKPHRYYDFAFHINGRLLSISDSEEEVEDVTHWAYADQIGLPDSIPLYERWARSPATGKITAVRDCVQWGDCTVYGTVDGVEQKLFSYYIDELTIHSSDLIGMTPAEAIKFKRKKDEGYLRS
jgi:hypothetical protein